MQIWSSWINNMKILRFEDIKIAFMGAAILNIKR